jgi:ribosomal-protein-serine acetyltransferase
MDVPDLPGPATLRLLEDRDAEQLYGLIDANRERLARWFPWAAGQTLEGTRAFIRESERQRAAGDGMQTAIVLEGAIAGIAGVHAVSRVHECISIGYWLAEPFTGRGLMTETVRAYTRHAFDVWGMHRMELRAAVGNARSRAVAERVGDRHLDVTVYSALAPEWPPPVGR